MSEKWTTREEVVSYIGDVIESGGGASRDEYNLEQIYEENFSRHDDGYIRQNTSIDSFWISVEEAAQLTDDERELKDTLRAMVAAMPQDIYEECVQLAKMNDADQGLKFHKDGDNSYIVTWIGRRLGRIVYYGNLGV